MTQIDTNKKLMISSTDFRPSCTDYCTARFFVKFSTKKIVPLIPVITGQADDDGSSDSSHSGSGTQTLVRPKTRVKEPSFYKVLLLNDDFTPMDFVVLVLKKFFRKSEVEAVAIMSAVHNQGSGVAGVFSFEVAETKVYLVNDFSRKNKHPLKCIMEKS